MAQTYSCFIQDRRYSVPTLRLLEARDAAAIRELALRELLASDDHREVEVRGEDGELIFRKARPVDRSKAAEISGTSR